METIAIKNQKFVKNVELINSLGLICTWHLINFIEQDIVNIDDIKSALEKGIAQAKENIDVALALYEQNKDFDFDGYYERNYEGTCETWSCLGLDLEKLS